MSQDLLNIGEFAKLAETTRRTVLWYEEKGILKPRQKDLENGYRQYSMDQIIDFKAIMLLRKLNFSLAEIKNRKGSLENLFNLKKKALEQEISELQITLKNTEEYYQNIKKTGTLVNPKVKIIKQMTVYYLDKTGPYREIGDYFKELRTYFSHIPKETLGLVLYEGHGGYQPKEAKVKVCLVNCRGLKPNKAINKMVIPGFKALSYTYNGLTRLLSMLWKELEKYQTKNGFRINDKLFFEDMEISYAEHVTEMLLPIK